ncbi:MAG: RNA methyltransferase [Ignavibacteriales bacterium]|nr:RNA methyltransferase [Ignavibacteriales bacterium]
MNTRHRISQTQLKYVQKLTQKKYRETEKKFLIEGTRLVEEALSSDWQVLTLLMSASFQKNRECETIIRQAESKKIPVLNISDPELKKLSDTVTAQGIVGVVAAKECLPSHLWTSLPQRAVIVALDDVADPGNVGSILRTCDWFGVDAVLLNKNAVETFNPKVVRASMGAVFHLPILPDVDLPQILREAKNKGFHIIATTLEGGQPLPMKSHPQKYIVVFGNEAHGVSKEIVDVADTTITIPKFGRAESLNVAITCGVTLGMMRLSVGKE